MYLFSQLFFKTPNNTLKFKEKSMKNAFAAVGRPKLQKFSLWSLPWGHPTEPLN